MRLRPESFFSRPELVAVPHPDTETYDYYRFALNHKFGAVLQAFDINVGLDVSDDVIDIIRATHASEMAAILALDEAKKMAKQEQSNLTVVFRRVMAERFPPEETTNT